MTMGEGEGTKHVVGNTGDGIEEISRGAKGGTESIAELGEDGREIARAGKGFEFGTGVLGGSGKGITAVEERVIEGFERRGTRGSTEEAEEETEVTKGRTGASERRDLGVLMGKWWRRR